MKANYDAYKKSSFGPAFLFLGKKRREALAAYYAFCRLMDDIADEPGVKDRLAQLDFWREEVTRIFAGNAATALGRTLSPAVQQFGIKQDRFTDLIDGMQADIQGRSYGTFAQLEWYLWHVAGIVGLATLDILGVKGNKAEQLARELGFAVQLTNIVRDVQEDAQAGRLYLPADMFTGKKITAQDITAQTISAASLADVLARLAAKAETYYMQAQHTMACLPARKMISCRIMAFVYRANLAKIKKKGFVFSRAVKLSKWEKIVYSIYAICETGMYF